MPLQLDLSAPLAAAPRRADTPAVLPAPPIREPALSDGAQGRVVVRDAFELLASLADESVDLVVTDPPYESLQLHRARGTTTRLTSDWFETISNARLPDLLAAVHRVLKPDRHLYHAAVPVHARHGQRVPGEGFGGAVKAAVLLKRRLHQAFDGLRGQLVDDGGGKGCAVDGDPVA